MSNETRKKVLHKGSGDDVCRAVGAILENELRAKCIDGGRGRLGSQFVEYAVYQVLGQTIRFEYNSGDGFYLIGDRKIHEPHA